MVMGRQRKTARRWTELSRIRASVRQLGRLRPPDFRIWEHFQASGDARKTAEWAGVSRETVMTIAVANGFQRPQRAEEWSEGEVTFLLRLIARGMPPREIAGYMTQFTRKAINGKIHRLREQGLVPKPTRRQGG